MIYRAIGLMSGSSLDGLDIVFTEILENGGKWSYELVHAECIPYSSEWIDQLKMLLLFLRWITSCCIPLTGII